MSDTIIKVEHVSKEYRLGAIGGATLVGDLQSFMARIRGKEDPNSKIGSKQAVGREKFLALDDISFEVKKGERIGIIGHNGAGKSTFLKLLSRVTAPTTGTISYNGRIASMLEVGTGFHPELTGRENVYMNGAILGMTKAEIDRKFDDIVRFAEMEQFIDTPVKRYSSGMYVKLAFAVAAHLDSEIMIMDEVLAVGDMKFQQKCLGKMDDVSKGEGRTILYVSHNMNTIRQLCTRCIVLSHGKIIFDGDVEEAIAIYMNEEADRRVKYDFSDSQRMERPCIVEMTGLEIVGRQDNVFIQGEEINFDLYYKCKKTYPSIGLRFEIHSGGMPIGTSFLAKNLRVEADKDYKLNAKLSTQNIVPGVYKVVAVIHEYDEFGYQRVVEFVKYAMTFEVIERKDRKIMWVSRAWGHIALDEMQVNEIVEIDSAHGVYSI